MYTGQAWDEPLASKPPVLLEMLLAPILKLLQPGMVANLNSSHPYILSPLISTMQSIQINEPGHEPILPKDIMSLQEDDLHLLGMETNMSTSARKKYFSVKENLLKYSYEMGKIYTFTFYQHILHIDTLKIFGTLLYLLHTHSLSYSTSHTLSHTLHPSTSSLTGYDILRILGRKPIMAMAIIYEPTDTENEEEMEGGIGIRCHSCSHWNWLYKIEMWHGTLPFLSQPTSLSHPEGDSLNPKP